MAAGPSEASALSTPYVYPVTWPGLSAPFPQTTMWPGGGAVGLPRGLPLCSKGSTTTNTTENEVSPLWF